MLQNHLIHVQNQLPFEYLITVSYTHLDVYKRQNQTNLLDPGTANRMAKSRHQQKTEKFLCFCKASLSFDHLFIVIQKSRVGYNRV